jgi:hypothetical protein
MDMVKIMKKLAAEMMTADEEKGYVHDPDHKNRPKGGNWHKTKGGWSTAKPKAPVAPKAPVTPKAPVAPKPETQEKEPVKPVQEQKQEQPKPELPEQVQKPVSTKFRDKPEVKALRKRISVNPNRIVAELSNKTGYVKDQYKPMLVKLYKEWMKDNKGKYSSDSDGVAKIDAVKLALQMLQPPKFPKTTPKVTGGMTYLVKDNKLKKDEVFEMAGFKEAIKDHPRMSDKEYKKRIETGMRMPRNEQQLKLAFLQHMNPQKYDNMEAFKAAKDRVQKMSVGDFGKLLASLNNDETEEIV